MGDYLIVYASRAGETKKIGELIGEGIRIAGHTATIKKNSEIKNEEDLKGYDGYLFGSATYHGEMISSMKQLLFMAEKLDLKGLPGGSFGAFGWSGEACPRIYETMEHIFKMKMAGTPLILKSSWLDGAVTMAQEYGKKITEL